MDRFDTYHLEEFKQLHLEIGSLLGRVETLFRYAMVVAAVVYSWLVTNSLGLGEHLQPCLKLPVDLIRYAWFIPPAFVALTGTLAGATYLLIKTTGEYLQQLEPSLARQNLGWEQFLRKKKLAITGITTAAWIVLLVGCILASTVAATITEKAQHTECKSQKE